MTDVGERNDRVGDGGSDVGSHDHGDGGFDAHHTCGNEPDDGGGGNRRRLDQDRRQDANAETGEGVGYSIEQGLVEVTSESLDPPLEQFHSHEEEVEEADDQDGSNHRWNRVTRSVYLGHVRFAVPRVPG